MESEGPQEHATGPHPVAVEFIPHSHRSLLSFTVIFVFSSVNIKMDRLEIGCQNGR
jgi:hypothetical protein